jgi:hypothetical protein
MLTAGQSGRKWKGAPLYRQKAHLYHQMPTMGVVFTKKIRTNPGNPCDPYSILRCGGQSAVDRKIRT